MLAPLLDGLGELRVVLGPRGVRRERRAPPLVVLRRVDPGLRRRAALRAAPRGPQDALEARRDLEVRLLRVRVPFDEVEDDERLEQRQQPGHAPVRDEPRVVRLRRAEQEVDAALAQGRHRPLRPLIQQNRAQADADERGRLRLEVPYNFRRVGAGQDRQQVHERAAEVRVDDLQQAALAHVLVEDAPRQGRREHADALAAEDFAARVRRRAAEALQTFGAGDVGADRQRQLHHVYQIARARRRALDDAPARLPGPRAPGPRAADGVGARAHGLVVVLRRQHGLQPAEAVLEDF